MTKLLKLFIIFFVLISCSKKEKEENSIDIPELCEVQTCISGISLFSYNENQIFLTKNQSPIFLIPNYVAYAEVEFYTDKTLPKGLTINPSNGYILGTPTESFPETIFLIMIRYKDEAIRKQFVQRGLSNYIASFPIRMKVLDVAPLTITVNRVETSMDRRENLIPITITGFTGGSPTTYEISPVLPEGLVLNNLNGTISGSPINSMPRTEFQLIARNEGGIASKKIYIEVKGVPPSGLRYLNSNYSFLGGVDIGINYPIYSGDEANSFSVNPALPVGIKINSTNGRITGNPTEIKNNAVYRITASNVWGSTSFDLSLGTLNYITEISTGNDHTCLIKNKVVYCAGKNDSNQLGYNPINSCDSGTNNCSSSFNKIVYNSLPLEALSLTSSNESNCIIGDDKRVYCWGKNDYGQIGNGNNLQSNGVFPVKINQTDYLTDITKIEGGYSHFCAKKTNGELYCWGKNDYGQLGHLVLTYSPFAVKSTGQSFPSISAISDFSVGNGNTCFVKDSMVNCIGLNSNYNFGNSITANSLNDYSKTQIFQMGEMNNLTGINNVILGNSYSLGFSLSNELFSWGTNSFGQLGTGDTITYTTAEKTALVNLNPLNVSKGEDSFCYIKNQYGYCIGNNYFNFGNEVITSINTEPVAIEESSAVPFFGITKISKGYSRHRCVSVSGLLYCFGNNNFGQIGDNDVLPRKFPHLISIF